MCLLTDTISLVIKAFTHHLPSYPFKKDLSRAYGVLSTGSQTISSPTSIGKTTQRTIKRIKNYGMLDGDNSYKEKAARKREG